MGELNIVPKTIEEAFPVRNLLMPIGKNIYKNKHKFGTSNWINLLKEIEYMNFRPGKNNLIIFVGKGI